MLHAWSVRCLMLQYVYILYSKTRRHISVGSAALLSLFDGLDLLDAFEVKHFSLLPKGLKGLVRQRGLEVRAEPPLYFHIAFQLHFPVCKDLSINEANKAAFK